MTTQQKPDRLDLGDRPPRRASQPMTKMDATRRRPQLNSAAMDRDRGQSFAPAGDDCSYYRMTGGCRCTGSGCRANFLPLTAPAGGTGLIRSEMVTGCRAWRFAPAIPLFRG